MGEDNRTGISQEFQEYGHYEVQRQTQAVKEESISGGPRKASGRGAQSSFGKKMIQCILLAVVFGAVAGGVFLLVVQKGTEKQKAAEISSEELTELQEAEPVMYSPEITYPQTESTVGTVAEVARSGMPSVVAITSVSIQEIPSFFGFGFGYSYREYPSTGSGSGIIVGENEEELLIATNNHVVEGASTLSVCFIGNDVVNAERETESLLTGDGEINIEDAVTAKIKGTDEDNDLAVIAVKKADIPEDTMQEIKIAQIGSSDDLIVGEQVVAIGNALGYGQSVTSGWISALNRAITTSDGISGTGLIQTDAAINPGNSGGALLNLRGELIGINSAKYADNAVEGMGYAIPISKARPILEELMNRKTREKVPAEKAGYLGVDVADLSAEAIWMYSIPSGAFIAKVYSGSPAEAGGMCKGDVVQKMDGQKITGKEDLLKVMDCYEAGETIEIQVARVYNGRYRELTLEITLGNEL